MMAPLNLNAWIEENREFLKPPVGNKVLFKEAGDFMVMVVGGPNARKDYHYNESEELFFQVQGNILVKIQVDGKVQEIHINEGEMFLLPARTPHSPIRGENTIGLVIERVRKDTEMIDGLYWFCDSCNAPLKNFRFKLQNVETDFLPRFKEFYSSEDNRTCKKCGDIMEIDPRFI